MIKSIAEKKSKSIKMSLYPASNLKYSWYWSYQLKTNLNVSDKVILWNSLLTA
jgi:hypothetical protein